MICRAVILFHSGHGPDHYDLLVEQGEVLAAWRCQVNPAEVPEGAEATATRNFDHRKLYLTYEGPVSGNRGNVRRVAEGQCRLARQEGGLVLSFVAGTISGTISLRQVEGDRWRLRRLPAVSDE